MARDVFKLASILDLPYSFPLSGQGQIGYAFTTWRWPVPVPGSAALRKLQAQITFVPLLMRQRPLSAKIQTGASSGPRPPLLRTGPATFPASSLPPPGKQRHKEKEEPVPGRRHAHLGGDAPDIEDALESAPGCYSLGLARYAQVPPPRSAIG